jgi:hypothetical protein
VTGGADAETETATDTPTDSAPRYAVEPARVPPREHDLVVVARALFEPGRRDAAAAILRTERAVPARVSPTTMRLLRDGLARGAALTLAQRGGWRRVRALTKNPDGGPPKVVPGRLWERRPSQPPLRFTGFTFGLLRHLASAPLGTGQAPRLETQGALEDGDRLVAFLAVALLDGAGLLDTAATVPALGREPLVLLGFPDLLSSSTLKHEALAQGMAALVDPVRSILVEGLQLELGRRWGLRLATAPERRVEAARAAGAADDRVLGAFLDACDRAGRRDLAGFLLEAARRALPERVDPAELARTLALGLETTASLGSRQEARRAIAAPLRAVARLEAWDAEHRLVRHFDDEYASAQALLTEWEAFGPDGFRRAAAVRALLENELTTTAPAAGGS